MKVSPVGLAFFVFREKLKIDWAREADNVGDRPGTAVKENQETNVAFVINECGRITTCILPKSWVYFIM